MSRNREIDYIKFLQKTNGLYEMNSGERGKITQFIRALLNSNDVNIEFDVNKNYEKNKLNIYIVKSSEQGSKSVSEGNAAYSYKGDVLFIDYSYFLFGDDKLFDNSS